MDNVNDEIKKIVNDNERLINKLVVRQKRRLKQLSSVKEFIDESSTGNEKGGYPKLKELTKMKNALVTNRATPPTYLKADLRTFDFKSLGTKFDVILIDPPLEEYCRRSPLIAGNNPDYLTYYELANLKIEDAAANPSFIFIWSGDSDGLDRGRQLLLKWGYRRCEDIVWIKTNKKCEPRSVFQHTKEHCIMGIKGTVRRSTDGHFIHCNVDTDVIISEEPPFGKLYHIIEHFCLGRRRLELFGEDHNIRPGWLTIGLGLSSSNFDPQTYASYFTEPDGYLLGSTTEIENLRPKSPPIRDASTPKPALPGTVIKPKPKKSNAANILPVLPQMSQQPPPSMQPPPQILPPPFPHRWLPTMDGNIYGK
ncbi:1529_t:CDS:2 [Entrophospora sp. SA101]|nr:1529_t:CDS:2 [Entrophospora sp. SA101]CAJ0835830.1 7349_t:CDS:2 [Entrophospora sp. SA101]